MSIISTIRGWFRNMFSKETIEDKLKIKSAQSQLLTDEIQKWTAIYTNKPYWKKDANYVTLNWWALACNRLATRVCINLKCETDNDNINLPLNDVLPKLSSQIEAGAAKGGLIIKPIPMQGKKLFKADFVTAENYIITGITSEGEIYGIMFISRKKSGDTYYTKFEIHDREIATGKYIIQNKAFKSKNIDEIENAINLAEVDEWAHLLPISVPNNGKPVFIPLFGYFKPAVNNNIDGTSMGIAFPHRAMEILKEADDQFNRLINELDASEKKTIIPEVWINSPRNGQSISMSDLPKVFIGMSMPGTSEPKEFNPIIRINEMLQALNEHARQAENILNLSRGTLSKAEVAQKTAREIKSTEDVSQTTISSNQEALRECIMQYCDAVAFYLGIEKHQFTWKPDDGVIDDPEKKFSRRMMLADGGYIPKWMLVMDEFGVKEEEAKKMVAEALRGVADGLNNVVVDKTIE